MTKKKGAGLRIKTEVLIVFVFFLCFIVWAISKCNNKKEEYELPTTEETATLADSTTTETSVENPTERPTAEMSTAELASSTSPTVIERTVFATKLYVSIEGLRLRRAPSVDSPFIMALPLFDELTFLNEVTDSTEIITLAEGIDANEPWVKVRHKKGHEGWVYGAGVHYYKVKFPGL
ncbi:MAG: SH3 domain-containing protein [Saprospiraceae bacterium]